MQTATTPHSVAIPDTVPHLLYPYRLQTVAVLGAGVMGAQIAAHCVNAGLTTYLFELPAEGEDLNANVKKAIHLLSKAEPSPLGIKADAQQIHPANYQTDLALLTRCDLVIEAIAERPDLKQKLYQQVVPYLAKDAILASNTSGLPLSLLVQSLPEAVQPRFCGLHFFNPPRYMHLIELTATPVTQAGLLDALETALTTRLGKGVLRAKDTPNFIANRIGVFSMMAALYHAERLQIPFDVVDALTGTAIGRPKSATFRTADVVGLDTLVHVVQGSAHILKNDPWHQYYQVPAWLQQLVSQGALGQKTRCGVYRKTAEGITVLDLAMQNYRLADQQPDAEVKAILKLRDWGEKLAALRASSHPQAQFLWAIQRDVFHYAAYWLADIAETARDVDLAMRWGFGWQIGPFEIWQAAGWQTVANWLTEEIATEKTMSTEALPAWVSNITQAHTVAGSWSPSAQNYLPPPQLPVYQRQYYPPTVLGSMPAERGQVVFENGDVRLWHRGDGIAILSFLTKMHTVTAAVLDGIQESLSIAERDFIALVIWQDSEPFSAGANLEQLTPNMMQGDFATVEAIVAQFQQTSLCLRYAQVPVVAAVRGLALGGGCEFLMHCDRVVAAFESYIGLVEVGVGLIPAGGGCKELAERAAKAFPDDPFLVLKHDIMRVGMGTVAKSAREAQAMGFLQAADIVMMHSDEVLHVACQQARLLAEANYQAPKPSRIKVAGRDGLATVQMQLVNMRDGGFISEHDYVIGCHLASVMCGGDVDAGTEVEAEWLLHLERKAFMELLGSEKTLARVGHTLKTGKPLRN